MKKIILILTIILSISCPVSYAGQYYELEEWDGKGSVYAPGERDDDTVWYYDKYGSRIYTTRRMARYWGMSAGGYYPSRGGRVMTGPGKYRREVRAEEKKGILTTILEILL